MIVTGPVIEGTPEVSHTLAARATWTGVPATTATWQWLRCNSLGTPCAPIAGGTSDSYVVVTADVGSVLRAQLTLTNADGTAQQQSAPTAVVPAPPAPAPGPAPQPTPAPAPAPTPAPAPAPSATPTPEPSSTPVAFEAPPQPTVPPATRDVARRRAPLPLLRPFPVVRIRGLLTATGARVTLLTIRAPLGARVSIRCTGVSCPARRLARVARVVRLEAFERELLAGTRLIITITRSGYIGKHTTIVIRRGSPPWRSDRCVYPSGGRPIRCPDH
jgi:hypothetical protein